MIVYDITSNAIVNSLTHGKSGTAVFSIILLGITRSKYNSFSKHGLQPVAFGVTPEEFTLGVNSTEVL